MSRLDVRGVVGVLLMLGAILLALSGCTPAYVTAGAVADGLKTAVGAYELANHLRRREILSAAQCSGVPDAEVRACFVSALAGFESARTPVAQCLAAAAPLVRAAEAASEARNAAAAASVLPELVAKAAECRAAIEEARR